MKHHRQNRFLLDNSRATHHVQRNEQDVLTREQEQTSTNAQQGVLCYAGWHLPSDAEWTQLTDYLGGDSVAGGKHKEKGTSHWDSPNIGATNETGFIALPGGLRYIYGSYYLNAFGDWWSSA